MPIDPSTWTREELERHSVDMRQFIDFRQSRLPNGMRIIDAYNSSGLTFTILPDRGLDIWTAHYKGIPLTWISQGSPHPPDFGQTWLQQFNGGLLTTCGLTHVGPPEKDDVTGEWRDLHGRYSRLRAGAELRSSNGMWVENTNVYERWIAGDIHEVALFGVQLRLSRRYEIRLGEPKIRILDVIHNSGDEPTPLMLLYHINPGFPLVRKGAQLLTAHHAVYPRDAAAKAGYKEWSTYEAAIAHYPEQVFFHHPLQKDHWSGAILVQHDFGIQVRWNSDELPYLTQWKNTRQGIYVCGIEPSNCLPEGLNAARRNNRLKMIEPGQSIWFHLEIGILDGQSAIQEAQNDLEATRKSGTPTSCYLDDYAQFAQEE